MDIHTLSLPGIIWKTVVDKEKNGLIIEWRSPEERKVNYASLDLTDMRLHFEYLKEQAPQWWSGLAGATENTFFLYNTPDPKFPELKGIYAYNSCSGEKMWENPEMQFAYARNGLLEARYGDTSTLLDAASGKPVKGSIDNNEEKVSGLPIRFDPEHKDYPKLKQVIRNLTSEDVRGNIEYLEIKERVVISYFTGEKIRSNWLLLLSEEGEITFREQIGQGPGEAFHTFFEYDNRLFTVKNKKEMLIFEL